MKHLSKLAVVFVLLYANCVYANTTLINTQSFRAPAADQRAYRIGDVLTIFVLEAARARSQAGTSADRSTRFGANASAQDKDFNGGLDIQANNDGAAQTSRMGEIRAQLTVRIIEIEGNGLMRIEGTQILEINKEQQSIRLSGLVRPEDISADNIVWSNRIANAQVTLTGKGVVSESQKPGVIAKVFTWLGLL